MFQIQVVEVLEVDFTINPVGYSDVICSGAVEYALEWALFGVGQGGQLRR